MQVYKAAILSFLVIVGLAWVAPALAAQPGRQKGELCEQTCPKSSCRKTCSAGTECVTYCSPNDYAICKCVKPDKTKKRPR